MEVATDLSIIHREKEASKPLAVNYERARELSKRLRTAMSGMIDHSMKPKSNLRLRTYFYKLS
jgi:hypothetical protein